MSELFSIKMRSSKEGSHISGAERIVGKDGISATLSSLSSRALEHDKGESDFINIKIERLSSARRLKALQVTTYEVDSVEAGHEKVREILSSAGVVRAKEIIAMLASLDKPMRGAMIVDVDTLERLEPDKQRGIRATYMDDASVLSAVVSSVKDHYREAIVLATKVLSAPGMVGEVCISDDPSYTTGYVTTHSSGYCRITKMKVTGSSKGGRVFLFRGERSLLSETIHYLEKEPVLVEDVCAITQSKKESRYGSIESELEKLCEESLDRHARTIDPSLEILCSNDYLGLSRDSEVIESAKRAAQIYGAGSTGSRLVTGTTFVHCELERHLASFKGAEDAILFQTGYMANVGTISALASKDDVIISDALNHASIIDGCRMSRAHTIVYPHLDMAALEDILSRCGSFRRRLVVSDAVFSMDGDILDLPRYLEICRRYDAFSMIDEAHSTGVLGKTGRGIVEHFGCEHPDISLGTLSKALGSQGGYVAGKKSICEYLRNKARSFIFSTSACPASVAAADAALSRLEESPELVSRLRENVIYFVSELQKGGLNVEDKGTAIVPIVIGGEKAALEAAAELEKQGFLVSAIRYPTVARGSARLRCAISAAHSRSMLSSAALAISRIALATPR